MTTAVSCPQTYYKTPSEVLGIQVDFTGLLRQGEMLSGSPTATVSPSGITTASVAVSTTPLVINGQSVEAGKAVTFTASAGTDGITYSILVSCVTSAGQTRQCYCTIIVATS